MTGVHSSVHLVRLRKTYMPRITYSRLTIKEKPAGNEDADETGFPTCGRHHARQLLQMPVPGRSAWESAQYTWQGLTCHRERERETLHLFQPPRADQMPDPLQGQD